MFEGSQPCEIARAVPPVVEESGHHEILTQRKLQHLVSMDPSMFEAEQL
jgi:hypothetical protein